MPIVTYKMGLVNADTFSKEGNPNLRHGCIFPIELELCQDTHGLNEERSNFIDLHRAKVRKLLIAVVNILRCQAKKCAH